jgi:hypothetical protein
MAAGDTERGNRDIACIDTENASSMALMRSRKGRFA